MRTKFTPSFLSSEKKIVLDLFTCSDYNLPALDQMPTSSEQLNKITITTVKLKFIEA